MKRRVDKLCFDRSPKRLALLWRVDSREADLVLALVAVEHRDRVAVGDANHAALDDPPGGLSAIESED